MNATSSWKGLPLRCAIAQLARIKTLLAIALLGSILGYLEPAHCESEPAVDRSARSDATTPSWVLTGNLNIARVGHTATLLPNGKVLVAGGGSTIGTP